MPTNDDRYARGRLREAVILKNPTCIFPYCGRDARRNQTDHTTPVPTGKTAIDNLAPPCTHHHRAKPTPAGNSPNPSTASTSGAHPTVPSTSSTDAATPPHSAPPPDRDRLAGRPTGGWREHGTDARVDAGITQQVGAVGELVHATNQWEVAERGVGHRGQAGFDEPVGTEHPSRPIVKRPEGRVNEGGQAGGVMATGTPTASAKPGPDTKPTRHGPAPASVRT